MSDNTTMPVARVAVLADTRLVDVVLPTELPLREIIPAIHRMTAGGAANPSAQLLSLGPVGGAPYSLDVTLDTVGVADGDLLVLQPVLPGPAAPGIVEDVADAAVIFSESRRKPWDITDIRLAARIAVLAVVLITTGFLCAYHAAVGGVIPVLGITALAAGGVGASLLAGARSPRVGAELAAVALVPIAAALGLAIPGADWAPHVMLAAAGVAAWSLIWMILRDNAIAFFTGVVVVGTGVLLAAAAATLWDLPPVSLGCGLILVALLVTVRAPQLSAAWARLPLPVIPAPGDPTPAPPPLRVLRDLPRRVRLSDSHQTGFVAGAVILGVLGSLGVAADSPGPWAWYLIVATTAGAVLRARVWDSAPCKAWLLAHPYLLATALLVGFTLAGRYVSAGIALGVLAVLSAVWVIVALNPRVGDPDSYSLPMRRAVGFFAAALDASLIPVMAYLVGIFDWVLNR